MKRSAPLGVVYLLVVALFLPAAPLAAEELTPTDTSTAPAPPAPQPAPEAQQAPDAQPAPGAQPTPDAQPAPDTPPAPEASGAKRPASDANGRPIAHAAAPGSVTIKDFSFGPSAVTVNVGDTVTWTNRGPSGHSATARDGSFDTGVLPKGRSGSHTFAKAGSFSYICRPHPFMKATVRVVAAASGGGSSGGSGGSGSASSQGSGTASGSAAAPGSGSAASSSGSAGTSSGSGSGSALPKTGADAGALAMLGLLLLGLGAALRRRSPAA
jgi:LPXTG-motif cell wall-anchored protein